MKNKTMRTIFLMLALSLSSITINAGNTGTWNAYMAYHDIKDVEKAGKMLYILASDNLYSYNTNDNSVLTYDKMNILSDCDISLIAYCNAAKRLVIVYRNGNIDILTASDEAINVSDFYTKAMTEDKTVNSIYIHNNTAYISTAFGILNLNVSKAEITDSYNLGFNVAYTYIEGNNIYAASKEKGLYAAALNDNLLDNNNWNRVGEYVYKEENIDPELLETAQKANPGGPKYNYFGFLNFTGNKLFSVPAGFSAQAELRRPGAVQVLNENKEWTIYQDDLAQITGHRYEDLLSVDCDPKDNSHVFAGGKTGLYEFRNGKMVKHYNVDNSPLESAIDDNNKNYVLIETVKFDKEGNLWCLNSQAKTQSLLKLTPSGQWESHKKSELMLEGGRSHGALTGAIFDSRGLLWFVNNHWNTPALFCYQPSTDGFNAYKTFVNDDGKKLEVEYVRCVSEDLDGNIWVGTSLGPLMLKPSEITNGSNAIFTQVKVPRNDGTNYADYLLDGVDIRCITIDGAGRKWFGTNGNGVYLISADNMTQVEHFLTSNSLLLSDNIESISINNLTGEVFFGTEKGLCSYMSDATQASDKMNDDNVYAYPNPVEPDYTGLITVVGLTLDADVKITTTNGALVAEGRSTGGTFKWDGCDLEGKPVASGIYMVQTATSEGKKGTVCKIAIVR